MHSAAATLLRLQRRASSRSRTLRIFGGITLVSVLVAAYAAGGVLSGTLTADEPERTMLIAAALILLVTALVSCIGSLLSTLGMLLGDALDEEEHLAALPLTFRDVAASRIAMVIFRAIRAGSLAALIVLACAFGASGPGFTSSVGAAQLIFWGIATFIAVLLVSLVYASFGILAALAFGRLVPARRREIALVIAAIAAAFGTVLAVVRFRPLLAGVTLEGAKTWLRAPLIPVRAALRLQIAVQDGGVEPVLLIAGFVAAAALLLWLAIYVWSRLLRHDLESSARPYSEKARTAVTNAPARSIGSSSTFKSTLLDRLAGRIQPPTRAVLVRDIRHMSRTTTVRLRCTMLAIALLVVALIGFNPVWLLLLLYYAASEIARDALMATLESDGQNLFFLQVVTPGLRTYLMLRGIAGFLITFGALIFMLALTTVLSPYLTADGPSLLLRSTLLAAAAWLAVESNILCAAVFVPNLESSGKPIEASTTELPVAVCGAAVALACAATDLHMLGTAGASGNILANLPPWLYAVAAALLVAGVIITPLTLRDAARRMRIRSIG